MAKPTRLTSGVQASGVGAGCDAKVLRKVVEALPGRWRARLEALWTDCQSCEAVLSALSDVLIANNEPLSEEFLRLHDKLGAIKPDLAPVQLTPETENALWLKSGDIHIAVWRGDITTVKTDVIVNAGNDSGLGCFQPSHMCIDNVIHRGAGPRLRESCRAAMAARGGAALAAGSAPIITPAHNLPATSYVLHVTGPQISPPGRTPTPIETRQLEECYTRCLSAAASREDITTIVFPCISTGLFGFPADLAAEAALRAVRLWLDKANTGCIKTIVFNVFTDKDEEIYLKLASEVFAAKPAEVVAADIARGHGKDSSVRKAARLLKSADAVLICAGAGLSINPAGANVYVSPEDFRAAYPDMHARGYNTAYESMGLFHRPDLPMEVKWGFQARHMYNMAVAFPPSGGYKILSEVVKGKDFFVETSNVDDAFLRSGFPADRLYTPQGSWSFYQCMRPCRPDSVFPSRPMLENVLPQVDPHTGEMPEEAIPRCRHCGGACFGNVRGGGWFLHKEYDQQQRRMVEWVESQIRNPAKRVVVLEIGAGFNTPVVTRYPMESIVRELGARGALVRINPSHPQVPDDINGVSIAGGWEVLPEVLELMTSSGSHTLDSEDWVPSSDDAWPKGRRFTGRGRRANQQAADWRLMLAMLGER